MKTDLSCGGVIVRSDREQLEVLLICRKGLGWGLPKGHPNEGEDLLQAAKREVQEETGYSDIEWFDKMWTIRYLFAKGEYQTYKTVCFYLGMLKQDIQMEQTLDEAEVVQELESSWFGVEDAIDLIEFEPMRTALLAGLGIRYLK